MTPHVPVAKQDDEGTGQEAVARRFLNAHGVVPRRALVARFEQLRDSSVVHVCAGVGWGKTAAVFELGLNRVTEGHRVRVATPRHPGGSDGDVTARPRNGAERAGRRMLLIDEVIPPRDRIEQIIDEIESGLDVRLVVASRGEHPVVEWVRERGLSVSMVGPEALRIAPDEFQAMARRRGVSLGGSGDYVARIVGGWPIVLNRFVEEAARIRVIHMSAALADKLIASSIRRVVGPLLESSAIDELSTAALADLIDDDVVEVLGLSSRLNDALAQVGALGLGTWQ